VTLTRIGSIYTDLVTIKRGTHPERNSPTQGIRSIVLHNKTVKSIIAKTGETRQEDVLERDVFFI